MRFSSCLAALSLAALTPVPAWAADPAGLAPLPNEGANENEPRPALTNASISETTKGPEAEPPASAPAPSALERVRRGVVLIERDGHLLGFGTVLAGDGRILTSLSELGGGDTADIRYADGTAVHAKVGHRDPSWDLALLVPRTIHWKDGLTSSAADPGASELRAPIPPRSGAKPIALPVHFKGKTDAISRQGDSLVDALDVEIHNPLPVAGAPILDSQAMVVGVLVHACRLAVGSGEEATKSGAITCAPTLIGAPVSALRAFLSHTPAEAVPPTPWLGIAGEPDTSGSVHGVRVMQVAPQSPAQKAGLKAATATAGGDCIVAVDGVPVETAEKLSEVIGKHAIGETVKLLVLGTNAVEHDKTGKPTPATLAFRDVPVVLRPAP